MLIVAEENVMQEIIVKNNTTGLKVFINGTPDLKRIPKDVADTFIYALAVKTEEYAKKHKKR
jgi:hypothetical protein